MYSSLNNLISNKLTIKLKTSNDKLKIIIKKESICRMYLIND